MNKTFNKEVIKKILNKDFWNKVFNHKVMRFIMILLFFKPICFQYYSSLEWIENIFVIGKIIVAFLIILEFSLDVYEKFKTNKLKIKSYNFLIKILIFELWIFLVTLFNQGAIFRSAIDLVSTVVIAMMIIKLYNINSKEFLQTFRDVLFTLILLQFASEIIWHDGMPADLYHHNSLNPLYFVTLDNGITPLACLCIALIFINYDHNNYVDKKRRDKCVLSVLICLITTILSGSSTGIICTLLLTLSLWIARIKKYSITEKGWLLFVAYASVSLLLFTNNSILESAMELVTGKNNFTGRNHLWAKAVELIIQSPIVGYGIITKGYIQTWGGFFSSHNMILEMILQGGLIALFLWLIIMCGSLNTLNKIQNYKIKRNLTMLLFIILVAFTMESPVHSVYLFSTFSLIYVIANQTIKKEVTRSNKSDLVSIVVPCYNSEKYINKCIESIVNQSYDKLEIILINDGSKDNTVSIINDWKERDNRIIVINKKNSGVSDTRNKGIKKATGKYITFIDSDDYIDTNMIERLVSEFDEEIDMVIGGFRVATATGIILNEVSPQEKRILTKKEFYEDLLKEKEFIASFWGKMYKTSSIKRHKIDKKLKIAEDLDFLLKISNEIKKVKLIPNTYYYYFANDSSVTRSTKFEKYKNEIDVLEKNKNNKHLNEKLWQCRYLRINLDLYFRYRKTEPQNVQYCLKRIKEMPWTTGLNKYFNIKQIIKFIIAKII